MAQPFLRVPFETSDLLKEVHLFYDELDFRPVFSRFAHLTKLSLGSNFTETDLVHLPVLPNLHKLRIMGGPCSTDNILQPFVAFTRSSSNHSLTPSAPLCYVLSLYRPPEALIAMPPIMTREQPRCVTLFLLCRAFKWKFVHQDRTCRLRKFR